MSVDGALRALAGTLESGQPWPRPRCPNCGSGHVRFREVVEAEGLDSTSARDHPAFDPEWIRGTFSARGDCENPGCQQAVHGTGDFYVELAKESWPDDPFQERGLQYSSYYRVTNLHPPMLLMSIPESAPDEVREGVLMASRVLFAAPGLAATALRATVERFLTFAGVSAAGPNGKFRTAHRRIEDWRKVDPARGPVADLFSAVKWLGNAGTHEDSDLTAADVLDGAVLLDEAFHRLFTGPDIDARAATINSAQGPIRPRASAP